LVWHNAKFLILVEKYYSFAEHTDIQWGDISLGSSRPKINSACPEPCAIGVIDYILWLKQRIQSSLNPLLKLIFAIAVPFNKLNFAIAIVLIYQH
jgi:hypothetical protein